MRKAFLLPFAIFTLLSLWLFTSLALEGAKTSLNFVVESSLQKRAYLFLESSLEKTIYLLQKHNRQNGCIRELSFQEGEFRARVKILRYYLYQGVDNDGKLYCEKEMVKIIETPQSNGYVWIEIVVTSENIRIVRRSLIRV